MPDQTPYRSVPYGMRTRRRRGSFLGPRLVIGLGIVAFAFFSYQCSTAYNPVTGEEQHLSLTPDQEIALGLQAMPEMMAQHGGEHPDPEAQARVDRVGKRIVAQSDAATTDWQYDFHLLADPETVNAFALPGGPSLHHGRAHVEVRDGGAAGRRTRPRNRPRRRAPLGAAHQRRSS